MSKYISADQYFTVAELAGMLGMKVQAINGVLNYNQVQCLKKRKKLRTFTLNQLSSCGISRSRKTSNVASRARAVIALGKSEYTVDKDDNELDWKPKHFRVGDNVQIKKRRFMIIDKVGTLFFLKPYHNTQLLTRTVSDLCELNYLKQSATIL